MKKTVAVLFAFLFIALSFCSCNSSSKSYYDEFSTGTEVETIQIEKNPVATIKLSDGSKIVIELYYYTAPNAVSDFIALAKSGQYDGMAFNQVKNSCIVMLGNADGSYSPDYYIKDETHVTGTANALSHKKGVVSMIREAGSDRCTGQFFMLTKDQTHFDGRFTSFGVITEGLDVVEKIAATELNSDDMIDNPLTIKSVSVKTYGADFPSPVILPTDSEQ